MRRRSRRPPVFGMRGQRAVKFSLPQAKYGDPSSKGSGSEKDLFVRSPERREVAGYQARDHFGPPLLSSRRFALTPAFNSISRAKSQIKSDSRLRYASASGG